MPAPCVRDPQVHPAPQSGLPSTGKATACHSDAPRKRRRHPVPGGACAVVATPRHGQCQPSGQLPPADAVKPHHVPAQGCTLQPLPCSPKGTSVSSLPFPAQPRAPGRHKRLAGPVCQHPTHTCLRARVTAVPRAHTGSSHQGLSRQHCPAVPAGLRGGAAGKAPLWLGADSTPRCRHLLEEHIEPRGHPHAILATIPQAQGLAMLSVVLASAGNLLCRHKHPPPLRKA